MARCPAFPNPCPDFGQLARIGVHSGIVARTDAVRLEDAWRRWYQPPTLPVPEPSASGALEDSLSVHLISRGLQPVLPGPQRTAVDAALGGFAQCPPWREAAGATWGSGRGGSGLQGASTGPGGMPVPWPAAAWAARECAGLPSRHHASMGGTYWVDSAHEIELPCDGTQGPMHRPRGDRAGWQEGRRTTAQRPTGSTDCHSVTLPLYASSSNSGRGAKGLGAGARKCLPLAPSCLDNGLDGRFHDCWLVHREPMAAACAPEAAPFSCCHA